MTQVKDGPVDVEESRNAFFDSLPSVRTTVRTSSITARNTDTDTNTVPAPVPVPVETTSQKPIDVTKYMGKNSNILRGREVFLKYENHFVDIVVAVDEQTVKRARDGFKPKPELRLTFAGGERHMPNPTLVDMLVEEVSKNPREWVGARVVLVAEKKIRRGQTQYWLSHPRVEKSTEPIDLRPKEPAL